MQQSIFHFLKQRRTESILAFLIVASCFAIVLESFVTFRKLHADAFMYFEAIVVTLFALEYLMRLYVAPLTYPNYGPIKSRLKFIFSFGGFIDLLAILPFFLPRFLSLDMRFLRIMRISRLLRIFKLYRYSEALRVIGRTFYHRGSELMMAIVVTLVLLLVSATLMWHLEHEAQPDQFPNIVASFWWAIATLTTVGYGDVYPITAAGKFVGGIIALLGVGLVALPAGILSASFVEHFENKYQSPSEEGTEQDSKLVISAENTSDALGGAQSSPRVTVQIACTCPNCGHRYEVKAT